MWICYRLWNSVIFCLLSLIPGCCKIPTEYYYQTKKRLGPIGSTTLPEQSKIDTLLQMQANGNFEVPPPKSSSHLAMGAVTRIYSPFGLTRTMRPSASPSTCMSSQRLTPTVAAVSSVNVLSSDSELMCGGRSASTATRARSAL